MMSRARKFTLQQSAQPTTSQSTATDINNSKMNSIKHCGDPHWRKQEEFGVLGNTVKIEGELFVGCQVIGAPPHTSCPGYAQLKARNEKLYRMELINSGEFGKRDEKVQRLGFHFSIVKKEKLQKLQVSEDRELKQMAFNWSPSEPSQQKQEETQKSREKGEELAAERKMKKKEKKETTEKNLIKQKKKDSFVESGRNQGSKPQFKTNKNEVSCKLCRSQTVHICADDEDKKSWTRRGGWPRSGGLCGGAPAGRSSNVSTGS